MREWIVTNGLGSYASLTHSGETTSKFHGLLVASLEPPTKRWMFVSNITDRIQIKERVYPLKGHKCKFVFDFFPSLIYDIDGVRIKKTFFMEHGKNTTFIKYTIVTTKPVVLSHIPVINSRHFYDATSPGSASFSQDVVDEGVYIRPSNINKILKMILKNLTVITFGNFQCLISTERIKDKNMLRPTAYRIKRLRKIFFFIVSKNNNS